MTSAPLHLRHPGVALGCMRLSTDEDRDEARARATIEAAFSAGVRVFDTARAYGRSDEELGHNERWLAEALGAHLDDVALVTKGGMRRPGGGWRPDGKARSVRADAEASAEIFGRPVDLWLLHSLDPRTPMKTSLRAMKKVLDDGTARAIGICNVDRTRLDEALELSPLSAVQVGLSPFQTEALRGGVLERCAALGLTLMAHSPFGGPAKAARVARHPAFAEASESGRNPHRRALAWLCGLSEVVVPVAGARRPRTASTLAPTETLESSERARLRQALPASRFAGPRSAPETSRAEVVVIMGLAGAGKTTAVAPYVERGDVRLNRDERGGTLKKVAQALRDALAEGAERVVLDNTYLGRAQRADVIAAAWDGGARVRCVFVDTPPAEVRINLCERLLDRFGELPEPDELRRSKAPGVFAPTTHQSMLRRLEPPALDEGFFEVERMPFERAPRGSKSGLVVALGEAPEAIEQPTLELGWSPGESEPRRVEGEFERAVCVHAAGPPRCWCRPPLPGLVIRWARAQDVDLQRITLRGGGRTFATLARELGAVHEP